MAGDRRGARFLSTGRLAEVTFSIVALTLPSDAALWHTVRKMSPKTGVWISGVCFMRITVFPAAVSGHGFSTLNTLRRLYYTYGQTAEEFPLLFYSLNEKVP